MIYSKSLTIGDKVITIIRPESTDESCDITRFVYTKLIFHRENHNGLRILHMTPCSPLHMTPCSPLHMTPCSPLHTWKSTLADFD